MLDVPKNRDELFALIADTIGWGATVEDVKEIVSKFEDIGITFCPTVPTPAMRQCANLQTALSAPANPFGIPQA